MISVEKLNFAYTTQSKLLFKNLNLKFNLKKKYLITGANGSGKSSLLKLIAEIEKPLSGKIIIASEKGEVSQKFIAPRCSYFSQELGLFPHLTVKEHLSLFAQIIPDYEKAIELANKFKLNLVTDEYVAQLSKGQQVKLALTLNLYFNPQVILLDEPTNALDSDSLNILFQELDAIFLHHKGSALLVIVSHQVDLFRSYCSDLINMEKIN